MTTPFMTDDDAPCVVCGDAGWSARRRRTAFVFCDGCNDAYHLKCAELPVLPAEGVSWFCKKDTCAARARGGATFAGARRPRVNKAERRARLGLGADDGVPSAEEAQQLLQHAVSAATTKKRDSSRRLLEGFLTKIGSDKIDEMTLVRLVLWRTGQGLSAGTIEDETRRLLVDHPGLNQAPIDEALKFAKRYADVPSEAKEPLTLERLEQLKKDIMESEPELKDQKERDHVRARDWTFYLVSFAALLRGSETAALLWEHVRITWTIGDQVREERMIGEDLEQAGGRPTFATIYVVESKTDQEGRGAPVRIAARPGATRLDCPVQMLRHLWTLRRPEQLHVFAEVRARAKPIGLKADTFRSRLKKYLAQRMTAPDLERISLHSLRKGGATAAAANRLPLRLIKHQGRWKSDAALVYLLVSDEESLSVSDTVLAQFQAQRLAK